MLTKSGEDDLVADDEPVANDEIDTKMQKNTTTTSLKSMINSAISLNDEKNVSKEKENDLEEEEMLHKELEASSKGKIEGSLYLNYFKSANRPITLVFLVVTFLTSQVLASFVDIWVAYW